MGRDEHYEEICGRQVKNFYGETVKEVKCKNFVVCNTWLPDWWYDCKGHYLCTNCHMNFGTWGTGLNKHYGKGILDIIDEIECPICLNHSTGISQPRCDHYVCISCFNRCYYGNREGEPEFPYPDVEDEYENDPENDKWNIEYPLIAEWNQAWENWDDLQDEIWEKEEYLRCCPICRQ